MKIFKIMTTRRNLWLLFGGIILIALFSVGVDFTNFPVESGLGRFFNQFTARLGLDLQGGAHFVYEADMKDIPRDQYNSRLEGVRDVIERRVNAFGIAEPIVQTTKTGGRYRVVVELPGIKNLEEAKKMIGETPFLDFREEMASEEKQAYIEKNFPKEEREQLKDVPMFKPTALSGKQLKNSSVQFDQTGQSQVSLTFNSEGAKLFGEITKRNINRRVAIYLDGIPISEPVVQTEITGGEAVITGSFNFDEAKKLSERFNAGALPVPISIISEQTVGATLGKLSLERSLAAGIIGLIFVSLYMIIYYRFPGILAVFALIFYALIFLAIFKMIGVVLTLAGIAGFILSIGMAVDANVLVFERMKEEMHEGRGADDTVRFGFKRAWSSIRDSNVSSLITCAILFYFGTSIVQGFALTLAIGVLVSMFSSMIVTRVLIELFSKRLIEKYPALIGVNPHTKLNS